MQSSLSVFGSDVLGTVLFDDGFEFVLVVRPLAVCKIAGFDLHLVLRLNYWRAHLGTAPQESKGARHFKKVVLGLNC
jgi:hypothetical protein